MTTTRDFENAGESFARVSAEMFAGVLRHIADIALVIDADGRIRDASFGTSDLASAGLGRLVGRSLISVVTTESQPKVEALLAGTSAGGRWRHVNFPTDQGDDIPISLQMFGLGGGRMLAAGRDERQTAVIQRRFVEAQRELERAHARQRQADLRFQTMLALSDLAVMTLDGETLTIIDANPAAAARLDAAEVPTGQSFIALFARDDAETIRTQLARVAASGRVTTLTARLRGSDLSRTIQAALFRHADASRVLIRVLEDGVTSADEPRALFAALPHALVITDARLRIEVVNRMFVDQAQLSLEENAVGQPLDRFVGRNGVDTGILSASLRETPVVRNFVTVLVGAFGASSDVEVDAVRLPDDRYGFLIRQQTGERRTRALRSLDRAGLAERMTEVVGRVSLKEIVRDTADVIERLCIETALELTDDNRAAAAEMLGISRQSLYAKLARYDIGGAPAEE